MARPRFIKKITFLFREGLIRLALAIIRHRVTSDLAKVGYVKEAGDMWRVVREDLPGHKIGASMHEGNAIRQFVDSATIAMYRPTKTTPQEVEELFPFHNPYNSY